MSYFKNWMKKKGLAEDFSNKFKFNNDPDVAGDYDRDLRDLVKLLSTQYNNDFNQFVSRLASERGDDELRALHRRTQTDQAPDPWKPNHPADQDEIVPPQADRGSGATGGEE